MRWLPGALRFGKLNTLGGIGELSCWRILELCLGSSMLEWRWKVEEWLLENSLAVSTSSFVQISSCQWSLVKGFKVEDTLCDSPEWTVLGWQGRRSLRNRKICNLPVFRSGCLWLVQWIAFSYHLVLALHFSAVREWIVTKSNQNFI